MQKIIIAIDSFKGCLTSSEANQAAAEALLSPLSLSPLGSAREETTEVVQIPVSDGGDGWLFAFHHALGGRLVEIPVKDPLMRDITARYLIRGDTAVIEMAQASGLTLLSPDERNPLIATSYGTGQLVADAVRRGAKHIIVGLGGSATSDCGKGMLRALSDSTVNLSSSQLRFTIATDVTNPLCGEQGAAHVFAPQKGATPEMVAELDCQARQFAEQSARQFGYDYQNLPGAGAAGGVGYAFLQYLHADCRSGIELLLETVRFDELLTGASLVITGEGSADCQTLMGKLPYGILQCARKHGVPVVLIAGRIKDRQQLLDAGFSKVYCINPPSLSLEEAMKPEVAKRNICNLFSNKSVMMGEGRLLW